MGEFKPNIVVSDVFGSAGDVTAHHRDGKTFLRKRSDGGIRNPRTEAQAQHMEVHMRAMRAWRELPHSVQEQWNEFAVEVEPHQPPFDHSSWISGQNLFVSAYHGFYTLGDEHVPEPKRFEKFPPFSVKGLGASVEGEDLRVRVEVPGLEHMDASRYWLYGYLQLNHPGRGISMVPWRSIVSSHPCLVKPVTLVLKDYLRVWGLDLPAYQVNGRFVLIDGVTGYRNQKKKLTFFVQLDK